MIEVKDVLLMRLLKVMILFFVPFKCMKLTASEIIPSSNTEKMY